MRSKTLPRYQYEGAFPSAKHIDSNYKRFYTYYAPSKDKPNRPLTEEEQRLIDNRQPGTFSSSTLTNQGGYLSINPKTGYAYRADNNPFTMHQFQVPDNPWNTLRFAYAPYMYETMGVWNAKYDNQGNETSREELFSSGTPYKQRIREGLPKIKKDLRTYYFDDLDYKDKSLAPKRFKDKFREVKKIAKIDRLLNRDKTGVSVRTLDDKYGRQFVINTAMGNFNDSNLSHDIKDNEFYSGTGMRFQRPNLSKAKKALVSQRSLFGDMSRKEAKNEVDELIQQSKVENEENINKTLMSYNKNFGLDLKNLEELYNFRDFLKKNYYVKDRPSIFQKEYGLDPGFEMFGAARKYQKALQKDPSLAYKKSSISKAQVGKEKKDFIDFTDVTFTDDELNYANDNLLCLDGACLDRSFQVYDQIVASNIPGMPSSSSFKKDYGMSSAPSWNSYKKSLIRRKPLKYFYALNLDDRSVIKMIPKYGSAEMLSKDINDYDNYDMQPLSEKEQQWFDSQRGFTSGESDWTVDSWDYGGLLMDEGAKLIYTKSSKQNWTDKSEEERKKIYNSLPIGTYIGYGTAESKFYAPEGSSYNLKKGLHDSSHSAVVVGYAEDGEPIVYDHNQYRRISDHSTTLYDEDKLTNIIIPKHSLGKDKDYFKNKNLLKKESKELNLDISSLYKFGDKNVLDNFYNSLKENKANLMTDLKIDSRTYDEYAKNLLALAMTETEGGNSPELYYFGSTFGDTHGLTQLNIKNILDDEQLKPIADKYGISDKNDLDDPYKSAIASMIFHKRHQKAANKAYYQGRKGPSTRTYEEKESEFFKDAARSFQGKTNTFSNDVFMTEEGIPVDLFKGWNFAGIGYKKSLDVIQSELDAIKKGRYKAENKNGEIVITKKTYGNVPLDPYERALYSWFGYNTLKTADAQGGNQYFQKAKNFRNLIKDNNLNSKGVDSSFQFGGEIMQTYKNYIMGDDESKEAQDIFNKMNIKYYNEAKQNNMSPSNYIMSYVIK